VTRDRLDELAQRLFEAARQEQPTQPLPRQITAAMREREDLAAQRSRARTPGRRMHFGLALAAAALVTSTLILLRRSPDVIDIAAEKPATAANRSTSQPLEPIQPAAKRQSADVPTAHGAAAQPRASAMLRDGAGSAPVTLADELASLQRARAALRSGDAKQALRELDHYDFVLGGRQLKAEASLLRIEALSRAGQVDVAAAQARRFVQQNPNHPLVDRARSFAVHSSEGAGGQSDQKEDGP
jgi:hypothetical protein